MDKVNSVMYYNMDELGRLDAKSQRREQSLNIPISTLIQAKEKPFYHRPGNYSTKGNVSILL